MPVSRDKTIKNEGLKSLAIALPSGEILNIVYTRDKYTPKLERAMRELMDDSLPANSLAKYVASLVVDWDVFDWVDSRGHFVTEDVALGLEESPEEPEFSPLTVGTEEEVFEAVFTSEDDEEEAEHQLQGLQNEIDNAAKKKEKTTEKKTKFSDEELQKLKETVPVSTAVVPFSGLEVQDYIPLPPYKRMKLIFSEEALALFGIEFITTIITAIAADQRPNKKSSATSSDTF